MFNSNKHFILVLLYKFLQDTIVASKVDKFNKKLSDEKNNQGKTPFNSSFGSNNASILKPEEYGRPEAGTLSDIRGKKANVQIHREMLELCENIYENGKPGIGDEPDLHFILFGELFDIYVPINNKVVGLLLRARKYDLIHFEGEMLFQGFHDHVPIHLMHPLKEIKEALKHDGVGF